MTMMMMMSVLILPLLKGPRQECRDGYLESAYNYLLMSGPLWKCRDGCLESAYDHLFITRGRLEYGQVKGAQWELMQRKTNLQLGHLGALGQMYCWLH